MNLWDNDEPNVLPKTWTKAQRERASKGLHPANGMPLQKQNSKDGWNQCGNCKHLTYTRKHRVYYKCDLNDNTSGPGTDIRISWPACTLWEQGDVHIKIKNVPVPETWTMDWKNDDEFNKTGPIEQAIPIEALDEEETR